MNVDWIAHLPRPLRVAGYFTLQRLIGSHIGAAWRDFQRWTRFNQRELNLALEQRLGKTLESAVTDSEFYRNFGLKVLREESATEFLARFPILDRLALRENFTRIVADRLRPEVTGPDSRSRNHYDWLVVKTGGTTGTPTAVIHDASFRDYGRASRLFSQQLCGFPLGTRYFRLWGSEQDLMQSAEQLDRRILRNLLGEVPMNAFRARGPELERHLTTMRHHPGIQHLMTYVDAAAGLAMFTEEHGLAAPALKTIMACAGTVTEEWRTLLARTFKADVFDKYGSRECADIACECASHTGLHVYSPNVFVEVVDDSGNACPPGELGRVLVTLLNNHGFPMIRYAIGDMAIASDNNESCPCGLPFPRLTSIQGRSDDMLVTESGTLLSSVFVRHFVGVALNRDLIREWQLVQTGQHSFLFRYVPVNSISIENNLLEIKHSFRRALGSSAIVRFERVDEILPSPTGKWRWIVNETRKP